MDEDQYWDNRSSADRMHAERMYEMAISNLNTEYDYKLFSMLRPKLTMNGNKWCVLYGDNPMEGIAGFGDSPYLAILDFNKAFNTAVTPEQVNESLNS